MALSLPKATMAAACALGLAACTTSLRTPITNFATDYNRAIADTRNQMILLNILRAQHREPIYYSSVSEINGSIELSTNAGAGSEFAITGDDGIDLARTYGGSIGVSATSDPSFTVIPLNTEEFVRGALSPIREDTMLLLLSQGWNSSMLAPLFIERIECLPAAGSAAASQSRTPIFVIENDPEDYGGVWDFDFFRSLQMRESVSSGERYDIVLAGSDLAGFLAADRSAEFDVAHGWNGRDGRRESIAESTREHVSIAMRDRQGVEVALPEALSEEQRRDLANHCQAQSNVAQSAESSNEGARLRVVFRSTEGVIYYIGEVLREQRSRPAGDPVRQQLARFFSLSEGGGRAAVDVGYRGTRYFIPEHGGTHAADTGTTLSVVSLINQLLALQTTTEDLNRVSSTVRVR